MECGTRSYSRYKIINNQGDHRALEPTYLGSILEGELEIRNENNPRLSKKFKNK